MNDFIYLASPYSHPDPSVREIRFEQAARAAAKLMEQGKSVFCPISHSHPISHYLTPDLNNHHHWMSQDLAIMQHASKLYVLMLEGWDKSLGVKEEIEYAEDWNIQIEYLDPYLVRPVSFRC